MKVNLKLLNNIFNYNSPGSYECDCDLGFSFSNGTCLDVDECILGDNPCIHGTCENLSPGLKIDPKEWATLDSILLLSWIT